MRKMSSLLVLVLVLAASPSFAETKFALTGKNTKVDFVGTKTEGKHDGGFKTITGTAVVDKEPTTLKFEIDIDTTSLWSDNPKLTGHLKSDDFFGVKKNPKATFVSTKVVKSDKGYTVTGNLTLTGKKKSISFPADITLTGDKLTLTSTFKIDRNDFGITYGKGKIHPEVTIKVAVDAAK